MTVNTSTGQLHGTLELPPGKGPFPVVLIVPGSGPVDRDGNSSTGLDTDCYELLAQALAQKGVASLRYDKRGVAGSRRAGQDEHALTFSTFAGDAASWGQELRRNPRFSTLTILGHSEGTLVGMSAAHKIPADGFVSVAGPGEPLSKLLLSQLEPRLPPDAYREAQSIIGRLTRGVPVSRVPVLLEPVLRPGLQPYLISLFRVDPTVAIASLKIPVLIVQGERDLQVSVSDAKSLAKASPSARLALIPKMNHIFKDVDGSSLEDNLASYRDPKRQIDPRLAEAVSEFVSHLSNERSPP